MASSKAKVSGRKETKVKKRREPEELDLIFERMDLNHDGRISVRELMKASQVIGHNPTQQEAEQMIRDANPAQKGYVTKAEFKRLFADRQADIDEQVRDISKAFQVFDKDGSGSISVEEIKHVMSLCGEPVDEADLDEMLKMADVNGDGHISYEEFAAVMCDLN